MSAKIKLQDLSSKDPKVKYGCAEIIIIAYYNLAYYSSQFFKAY